MKRLKNNTWILRTDKKLGSGSFAQVFEGQEVATGKKVAIKQISNSKVKQYGEKLEQAIEREIKVLQECSKYDNPYLLKIFDYFESANNRYVVLEYCDSGDLQDVLNKEKRLPEKRTLEIAYQIVLGLSALFDLNVVHRDMKPENIFISGSDHKIGDFGFANQASKFQTALGTTLYMGPEFYIGRGSMDQAVDIWAFGCIIHQMMFGCHPFDGRDQRAVIQKVIHQEYAIPASPSVSDATADMLSKCLIKDPHQRIKIGDLRTHPCFSFCRNKIVKKLDKKVKQSFFGGGNLNVYSEARGFNDMTVNKPKPNLSNPFNGQGRQGPPPQKLPVVQATPAPVPKVDPAVLRKQQAQEVITDLAAFRNVYILYQDAANKISKISSTHLACFLIAKRGLQKATMLLYYLKQEQRPDPNVVPMRSSPEFWTTFKQSDLFPSLLAQVIQDCIVLRDEFEQWLVKLTNTFGSSHQIINDDLNTDLHEAVVKASLFTVKRINKISDSNPKSPDGNVRIGMFAVLIYQLEIHGPKISFYYDVAKFVNGVTTRPESSLNGFKNIVQNIANKG